MQIDIDEASKTASFCASKIRASLWANKWSLSSLEDQEKFTTKQVEGFQILYRCFLQYMTSTDETSLSVRTQALQAATESVCSVLSLSKDLPAHPNNHPEQIVIKRCREFQEPENIVLLAQKMEKILVSELEILQEQALTLAPRPLKKKP